MEEGKVSIVNKAPKATFHHLLAATTNAQCELQSQTVKAEKDSKQKGFITHSFNH